MKTRIILMIIAIICLLVINVNANPFLYHKMPSALSFAAGLNKYATENFAGFQVTSLSGSVLPEKGTAEEKMAMIAKYYRLQPDVRFMDALPQINFMLTGQKSSEKAQVSFAKDKWEIRYRNVLIGTLPEFPDFSDYITLLTKWASQEAQRHAIVATNTGSVKLDTELFFYNNLFPTLDACGQEWQSGIHSRACLRFSAHAYSALLIQSLDYMGSFKTLYSTPLASLALAKALTGEAFIKEEARIAYEMGYKTYVHSLLASFPPNDPLGLYLRNASNELSVLVHSTAPSEEMLYMSLMDIARQGHFPQFNAFLRDHNFAMHDCLLAVVKAAMATGNFGVSATSGELLQYMTLSESDRRNAKIRNTVEEALVMVVEKASDLRVKAASAGILAVMKVAKKDVVDTFEASIADRVSTYKTSLLTSDYVRAFNSGYFYSGIHIEANHLLNRLGFGAS